MLRPYKSETEDAAVQRALMEMRRIERREMRRVVARSWYTTLSRWLPLDNPKFLMLILLFAVLLGYAAIFRLLH